MQVMKVLVTSTPYGFEGLVNMPNFALTRLKKKDGNTMYENASNLEQAARQIARKYNCVLAIERAAFPKPRVAAKKTANK